MPAPPNPFRCSFDGAEEQSSRLQQAMEENGRLKDTVEGLKKEVSAITAQLETMKADQQVREMKIYSQVRNSFYKSRSDKTDAQRLKIKKWKLESEVKELQAQITQVEEKSKELRGELKELEPAYEKLPVTRALSRATVFEKVWAALIKEDEKSVKRRLQRKVAKMNRSSVEGWLKRLNLGLQKCDIARAVGKAVRNGEFLPQAFLAVMEHCQPRLVFEDVESVLAHLRVHFAVNNLDRRLVEQALSEVDGPEAAGKLSQPPFSLNEASASRVLEYLGGKPLCSLLQYMPECPALNFVVYYVRCRLLKGNRPLEDAKALIPVPFTLSAFSKKLQSRFDLTSDAALVLSTAVCSQDPVESFTSVLQLPSNWNLQGVFDEFLDNLLDTEWRDGLSYCSLLADESVKAMCLVVKDFLFSREKKFVAINALFEDLERLLGTRFSEVHRLAVEVKCLETTQVVGAAVDKKTFKGDIERRENYKSITDVFKPEPTRVDFDAEVDDGSSS